MEPADPTPSKPPRKRWSGCFIFAICTTAICTASLLLAMFLLTTWLFVLHQVIPKPALVVSEEITRITGPLTAEGHIDFFKALEQKIYPPELATDDNGFRVFVRLFGDVGDYGEEDDREFYRLQKYEKLGLDPDIAPTLTFPATPRKIFEDFYKAKGEDVPQLTFEKRPRLVWTLEEYPMFADWVNEIDIPLAAVTEAINKPVFFFPLLQSPESVESGMPQNMTGMILPEIQTMREIARIFQARATYRIGQGDIDGAIDDKLTLLRLGRLVAQNGNVQFLVGIAIEGMASTIPVGANPEHSVTEQQIRRILDGLDALPPRTSFRDFLEWDRYTALSDVQYIDTSFVEEMMAGRAKALDRGEALLWQFLWFNQHPLNSNIMYRRMNEVYDALQEPPPRTKYVAIQNEISPLSGWWGRKLGYFLYYLPLPDGLETIMTSMLIALQIPTLEVMEEAMQRMKCMDNMQRLALAILLYQHEHGKMPDENWAVQIEKYLGENPEQYFSCPSNPSANGETTYAMVQYGDELPTNPDTLLLVELKEVVPLDKAVITVDEVLARQRVGSLHSGGMNVALRSGAVRFVSSDIEGAELRQMLGRE